jgi:hypothetical protein
MQHCDSTCSHCAREFFRWWRHRINAMRAREGKSDFNAAAATSVRAP